MIAFTIGDDIIAWANDLFVIHSVENTMLLHYVAANRAKSPPGNIETFEKGNDFAFSQALRPIAMIDGGRFVLGVISVLEPLGGFRKNGLLAILSYVESTSFSTGARGSSPTEPSSSCSKTSPV